jgi:hypothetical protein
LPELEVDLRALNDRSYEAQVNVFALDDAYHKLEVDLCALNDRNYAVQTHVSAFHEIATMNLE